MSRFLTIMENSIPKSAKHLSRSKHKYKDEEATLDWKSPSAKLNAKEHAEFLKAVEHKK